MAVTVTYNPVLIGGDAGGDFQTNTSHAGDQILPDVLGLSGGGFVSAYSNNEPSDGFIYLNFYDADHNVIGGSQYPYDVGTDTTAIGQPKLTELVSGNVLVVWDENDTGGGDAGPHAAIFTPSGTKLAFDINLGGTNSTAFEDIDVAALDDGGFVLTYRQTNVQFALYDSAGVQQGIAITANTVTAGIQADPQVTRLSDGAFAITWTDTNPADQLIRARIFEANGTARTAELGVGAFGDNTQSSVAALHNGGLAVVYTDTGWAEGVGISLQIVSSAGAVGSAIHVNVDSSGAAESDPDVTVLANGFIAVTWSKPLAADNRQIHCRVFDQNGVAVMNEFGIAASSFDEVASAVSAMADGLFITSWQDTTSDGSGGSIGSQITELTRTVVGDAAANLHIGDELRESIDGMAGDDTVRAEGGADTVNGGAGDDTINGSAGDDILDGGNFSDLVLGGDGDDLAQGGLNADTINAGAGDDLIFAGTQADPLSSINGDRMTAGLGADTVVGAGGDDTVFGGDGDDAVSGGAGSDSLDGDEGSDRIRGQSGDDVISGFAGSDTINGGVGDDLIYADSSETFDSVEGDVLNGANGHDTIIGAAGDDIIAGLGRKDRLHGDDGADTINGGSDKDRIQGDAGGDLLTGGSEKDVFAYRFLSDSAIGAEDVLTDCGNHDFIDLSLIDAKTGEPLDQDFTLVDAFSGSQGELVVRYDATGPYAGFTTVRGDVDGDGAADFVIKIDGDVHNFHNFIY